jgi:hypothetical protein
MTVLPKDQDVMWRIILKFALVNFDANMCMHRIYVPPNRDQLRLLEESVLNLHAL